MAGNRRTVLGAALAAGTLAATGTVRVAFAQESGPVIEQIRRRGAMRVGLATFMPWVMRDRNGELIGYEIDVANRLARDLGVKVEFVPTAWDGIIPALQSGRFDLIIGGMTPTPQRRESIDFTEPYSYTGIGMVANSTIAGGRNKVSDFDAPNVTIAMRRGVAAVADVQKQMPKAQIVFFDDDAPAILEVLNGKAHAYVGSEPKPTFAFLDNRAVLYKPLDRFIADSFEAMGLRKGDPETQKVLNAWIAERFKDGFLKDRRTYWFATRDWLKQLPDGAK
jgi:polar amino acid transport system substrate-binding protein